MLNHGFGRATRRVATGFGLTAVLVMLLNLAFWLGLIAGTFYLVKHFFF